MKRDEFDDREVKSEGFTGEKNFEVDASAEMFSLISDSLYSRSIEAIVRELACNAYDSHVKRGNPDRSFDVKLPSRLDDEFYIRDYGVALTPEEVEKLYTVVFKSDKTHTNDLTGCFGVGSKSPFAYTDKFTVESFKDGKRWVYSVYLDEEQIPTIAELEGSPFDTDEDNGVKIKFSVPKRSEKREFEKAAKKVFRVFDPQPNILGKDLSIESFKFSLEGDGWGLRKSKSTSYSRSKRAPIAVMGNVQYEIDTSEVDKHFFDTVLFFNLGELTPAASREYLQYNEKTKKNIEAKFQEMEDTIQEMAKERVDDADTFMGACSEWLDMRGSGPLAKADPPEYRDTGIQVKTGSKPCNWFKKYDGDKVRAYYNGKEVMKYGKNAGRYDNIGIYYTDKHKNKKWRNADIEIVYADKNHAKWSKTQYYSSRNPDKLVYVVDTDDLSKLEKLKEHAFVEDHIKVSDLKSKPTSSQREPSDKANADWLKFTGGAGINKKKWGLCKAPEETYYVTVNRYKWSLDTSEDVKSRQFKDPNELKELLRNFKDLGFDFSGNLIGAKRRFLDEAEDLEGWTPMEEELDNIAEFMYNELKVEVDFLLSSGTSVSWKEASQLHKFINEVGDDLDDPILERFRKNFPVHEMDKREFKRTIQRLTKPIKDQLKKQIEEKPNSEVKGDWDELRERYPLFEKYRLNSATNFRRDAEMWKEYFNSVYNSKE